ncbi:MAG: DUF4058 family protein, partial [Gemmataceae bacterium]
VPFSAQDKETKPMSVHDWTRVEDGIFHDFHHAWIEEIKRALNAGLLPDDYYALAEQHAAGYEPDVLTLQGGNDDEDSDEDAPEAASSEGGLLLAPPKLQASDEAEIAFYRRKAKNVAVRHVSGDRIVAMLEVVSPGNKASRHAFRAFVDKACERLEHRIHLLILDPFPPSPRDRNGIHAAIWEEVQDKSFALSENKPLTLAAYECGPTTRAYIETIAVGDPLPDMPLFLEADGHVLVPLESTYQTAFAGMPRRWRTVLEPSAQS